MLIKYNKENMLSIPVNGNSTNTVRLMPGISEFPKEIFDAVKDHPQVKMLVESEMIEFIEVKTEKKGKAKEKVLGKNDEPVSLSELSEKNAKKLIKDTFVMEMLERWELEETRVSVKKVLDAKIDDIKNPKVKKK